MLTHDPRASGFPAPLLKYKAACRRARDLLGASRYSTSVIHVPGPSQNDSLYRRDSSSFEDIERTTGKLPNTSNLVSYCTSLCNRIGLVHNGEHKVHMWTDPDRSRKHHFDDLKNFQVRSIPVLEKSILPKITMATTTCHSLGRDENVTLMSTSAAGNKCGMLYARVLDAIARAQFRLAIALHESVVAALNECLGLGGGSTNECPLRAIDHSFAGAEQRSHEIQLMVARIRAVRREAGCIAAKFVHLAASRMRGPSAIIQFFRGELEDADEKIKGCLAVRATPQVKIMPCRSLMCDAGNKMSGNLAIKPLPTMETQELSPEFAYIALGSSKCRRCCSRAR